MSLRFYFSILRSLGAVFSGRKLTKIGTLAVLIEFLRSKNILDFLRKPRTVEEIKGYIGGVKREDLLTELLTVLARDELLVRKGEKYVTNEKKINEILEQYRKTRLLEEGSRGLRFGFSSRLSDAAVEILRGKNHKFTDAVIAITFFSQTRSEAYNFGRKLLLDLGGGKKFFQNKTILNLACGFGAEPAFLYTYLDGKCTLILAEFFENILEQCRQHEFEFKGEKIRLEDLPNVDFRLFDPEFKEPFDISDESVDIVFSFQLLHWTKHVPEIAKESYRILKDGGVFLSATPLKKDVNELHPTDILIKLIGGYKMWSEDELHKIFYDAGFRDISIKYSNFIVARKWIA
ncbi:MAG: hypothetical protein B6U95_00405 [Thermofilum sp. ex4484_82]|nr:MAG: hypothetical protein B6U95_00405 [Thermofilum sp. ex4484_82]OYT40077.1 MAG: hypothetical protein B6U96_00410 [Archaeoglobales archaeon ex4484_92]